MKQILHLGLPNAGQYRKIDNFDKFPRFFFDQMPGSGTFK